MILRVAELEVFYDSCQSFLLDSTEVSVRHVEYLGAYKPIFCLFGNNMIPNVTILNEMIFHNLDFLRVNLFSNLILFTSDERFIKIILQFSNMNILSHTYHQVLEVLNGFDQIAF